MFYFLRTPSSCNVSFLLSFLFLPPPLFPTPFPPHPRLGLNSRFSSLSPWWHYRCSSVSGFFIFIFDYFWEFSADLCVVFVSSKSPSCSFWLQYFPLEPSSHACWSLLCSFIFKGGHLNGDRASVGCGRDLLLSSKGHPVKNFFISCPPK